MLDSSKKKTIDTKGATTVGADTSIQGEVRCKGTIRIEGEVVGRIHSEDAIVIAETGKVKADLLAAQVVIGGEVQGNVFAQERCEITAQGKLTGDLTAPRVSIEEGVIFEGKCTMKAPGPPPPTQTQIPAHPQPGAYQPQGQPPRPPVPPQPPRPPQT